MKLNIHRHNSRNTPYFTVLQEVEHESGIFTKTTRILHWRVPHYTLSEEIDDGEIIIYEPRRFSSVSNASFAIQEYIKKRHQPLPEDMIMATVEIDD